jgi:hypothetical protein
MNKRHDTNTIKVLYYHTHAASSIPQRGNLSLSSSHLSFQSHGAGLKHKEHHIELLLSKIRSIDPYKGRLYPGIQIVYADGDSFIFTKVSPEWYETISNAIDAARVKHELEVTVKPRLLKGSQRQVIEEDYEQRTYLTFLYLPFTILFSILIKSILLTLKKITGHNYMLPNTVEDAICAVEGALSPIVKISAENQTKAIHLAIQEEVKSIHQCLERIKTFVRRKTQPVASPAGKVEDRKVRYTVLYMQIQQSFTQ